MRGADFLLCIAQVALTFAGFAGLIGAFRPSEDKWIPQEVAGLHFILHHTLMAVVLSLLPFLLLAYECHESTVWVVMSVLLGGFLFLETSWQWYEVARLTKAGYPPRRATALYASLSISFVLVASMLLSLRYGGTEGVYKSGLLWLLITAGIQFLHFVSYFAQTAKVNPVRTTPAQQIAPPDAP
jgi:hypothetical protein